MERVTEMWLFLFSIHILNPSFTHFMPEYFLIEIELGLCIGKSIPAFRYCKYDNPPVGDRNPRLNRVAIILNQGLWKQAKFEGQKFKTLLMALQKQELEKKEGSKETTKKSSSIKF